MDHYYTAAEVAAELGCVKTTVTRHAKRLGMGVRDRRGTLGFTRAEVDRLRTLVQPAPGNPAFTPGNGEWVKRWTGGGK